MPIDWVELSRAVPYAGVAIIFGLFMVIILKITGNQRDKADERRDKRDKERDSQFISAIAERDRDWRTFMAEQQNLRNQQWADVVAELKQLATNIGLSTDLLRTHDSWERGLLAANFARRADDDAHTPSEA